jgi:putative serine protease PepD
MTDQHGPGDQHPANGAKDLSAFAPPAAESRYDGGDPASAAPHAAPAGPDSDTPVRDHVTEVIPVADTAVWAQQNATASASDTAAYQAPATYPATTPGWGAASGEFSSPAGTGPRYEAADATAYPPGYPADPGNGPAYGAPSYPAGTWPPAVTGDTVTPKKSKGFGSLVTVALVAGLLAGALGGAGGYLVAARSADSSVLSPGATLPQSNASLSTRPSDSIAAVAKAVLPVVVSISVDTGSGGDTGSGVVLRSDGYILTNNHVIASAVNGGGTITVSFNDGTIKPAKIVGRDTSYDLAVIKVVASGLTVASLGNSENVAVGDEAIAVGSPLGLSGTVTSGIISALNRPVSAGGSGDPTSFINAIQTDAAVNPGNSGGALVNAQGLVIGINSAIATLSSGQSSGAGQSGSIGLGFAIPINEAKRIAEELISTGKATHPVIGVSVDQTYTGAGAKVSVVTAGGPAETAGIASGDIIVAVNGRTISNSTELIVAIRSYTPGATVTLTLRASGGSRQVKVILGADSGG